MIVIVEPPAPPVALAEVKAFAHRHERGGRAARRSDRERERDVRGIYGRALLQRDLLETLTALGLGPGSARRRCAPSTEWNDKRITDGDAYAIDIDAAGDGLGGVLRAGGDRIVRVAY